MEEAEPPSFLLSSTLSKMRPTISKYSVIPKCIVLLKSTAISKWQLNSTLASFLLLSDYLSVKLTVKEAIKAKKDNNERLRVSYFYTRFAKSVSQFFSYHANC